MGVGSGLYLYDVVVKRSRSLSDLLMNFCTCKLHHACLNSQPQSITAFLAGTHFTIPRRVEG